MVDKKNKKTKPAKKKVAKKKKLLKVASWKKVFTVAATQLLVVLASVSLTVHYVMPEVKDLKYKISDIEKVTNRSDIINTNKIYYNSQSTVVKVRTPRGHGSGFVISKDGLVITNWHVVTDEDIVTVIFSNLSNQLKGESLQARVLHTDKIKDVAVLRIIDKKAAKFMADGNKFQHLNLSPRNEIMPGTMVMTIGYPFGFPHFTSLGIISNILRGGPEGKLIRFYSDAQIFPGNSGGPLIDIRTGKVFGINTWTIDTFGHRVSSGTTSIGIKKVLEKALEREKERSIENGGKGAAKREAYSILSGALSNYRIISKGTPGPNDCY